MTASSISSPARTTSSRSSVETGEILWSYEAHLDQSINAVCCGWTSRGCRPRRRQDFRRSARRQARRARSADRRGRLVGAGRALAGRLSRSRARRSIRRLVIRASPAASAASAAASRPIRGRRRQADLDVLHRPRSRRASVTTRGRRTTTPGGTAAPRCGRRPPIDPELGLIYFSTGNPGPDFNGSVSGRRQSVHAPRSSRSTCKTGKYRWHFQQVHHDIWDYDAPNPVVLFDVEIDGRMRKGLAEVARPAWSIFSTARPASRWSASRNVPCRRSRARRPRPPSPIRVGDAGRAAEIEIAPEGCDLVNGGRIFTPYYEPVFR